jgi:hypothetical protein
MGISLYSWKPMVWSWIENKMYIYVDLYADGSLCIDVFIPIYFLYSYDYIVLLKEGNPKV